MSCMTLSIVSVLGLLHEELPKYIEEVKLKHSENAKAVAFSSFIQKVFNVESRDLDFEIPIKTTVMEMKGRIDTVFGNLIIEFKKDLNKSLEDAKDKLIKYFQAYREKYPDSKYIGIASDGIYFKVFYSVVKENVVVDLEEIDELNLENRKVEDVFRWFDSYFFSSEKITPTSSDLKKRFGLDSPTFAVIQRQLEELFEKIDDYRPVKVKYENWLRYLEIVYGDKPGEKQLFFKHTYLSTFVKLLIHVKLSKGKINQLDEITPILFGDTFRKYGILNFMEEDFFTWISFVAIRKSSGIIFKKLLRELFVYDLEKINEDVLKELYQELVDPDVRKLLGEFYTPDWLADKMVADVLLDDPTKSVLDPSCGSGTFLFKAIRYKIDKLKEIGKDNKFILDHVLKNIVGFDVHPLAVIIAKTNYLLALKDLLGSKTNAISIPVFLSDSLKTPTEKYNVSTSIRSFEFSALDKKFLFPVNVASDFQKMDDVIEKMKSHGDEFQEKVYYFKNSHSKTIPDETFTNLVESFKRSLSNFSDDTEKEIMTENIIALFELIKAEADSIWTYVLRNMYKPIAISHQKVDAIIGNPPWLALQAMKNLSYQQYLKKKSLAYGLSDSKKIHNIPNLELATLFFCQCSEQYLNETGGGGNRICHAKINSVRFTA